MRLVIVFALTSCALLGQAMVERALLTGATATAGSSAKRAGTAAAATTEKAAVTLATAPAKPAPIAPRPVRAPNRTGVPILQGESQGVEDSVSAVDPEQVKPGMTREELIAAAGKPWMKMTLSDSERLTFQLKDGGLLKVVLENGKVTETKRVPGDGK